MSARLPAADELQPESFAFTKANLKKADEIIAKYPKGRQASAVLPLLDLAQRQHENWLPRAAMDTVATMLNMPFIRVYEVATFFTMFNLAPVGEHFIQLCKTTPCWLRGSDDIKETCKKKLGIDVGETTNDGRFSIVEVECLGACVNAPIVQINDDYYEDVTPEILEIMLDKLLSGKKIEPGPQIKRMTSAPEGGFTTLKDTEEVA